MYRPLACAILITCLTAGPAQAAIYEVDATETRATFETRFLGIVPVRGEFKKTGGQLDYDPATRQGSLHAFIQLATLRTHMNDEGKTDQMLKGPEFFDVEHYPLIDFVSSKFRWEDDKLTAIEGTLTVRGTSKPATLSISKSRCYVAKDAAKAETAEARARCEASAQLAIKRSQFHVSGWSATVSDNVYINIEFVAVADGKPADNKPVAPVDVRAPAEPAAASSAAPAK